MFSCSSWPRILRLAEMILLVLVMARVIHRLCWNCRVVQQHSRNWDDRCGLGCRWIRQLRRLDVHSGINIIARHLQHIFARRSQLEVLTDSHKILLYPTTSCDVVMHSLAIGITMQYVLIHTREISHCCDSLHSKSFSCCPRITVKQTEEIPATSAKNNVGLEIQKQMKLFHTHWLSEFSVLSQFPEFPQNRSFYSFNFFPILYR